MSLDTSWSILNNATTTCRDASRWCARHAARRAVSTFSLSADLLEPGRGNIFERWESVAAVEAFRGSGSTDEQSATILAASVAEYDVGDERSLT